MPFGLQPVHLIILVPFCLILVGGIVVLGYFVSTQFNKRTTNPAMVDSTGTQTTNTSLPTSVPSDAEQVFARMKSYTGSAVLVFFLYYLFWLPGLIVNFIFYNEAKRMERTAGQSLPGVGCLTAMLWFNVVVVVVGILLVCVIFGIGGLSSLGRH